MKSSSENDFDGNLKEVSWRSYLNVWMGVRDEWILRGQSIGGSLKSGLERALTSYDIPLDKAPEIEEWMIRDFRRKYEGIDTEMVSNDTLYCLSMMQHYGCPTRLLDFTYSPYVAAFFAVENISLEEGGERKAFVFCFNHKWINGSARRNIGDDNLFRTRFSHKTMTELGFKDLYMQKRGRFIVAENPEQLHTRLSIQRGVFIIQGDISKSMMENIKSMEGWQSKKNIIIYKLKIETSKELREVYRDLRLMNITHESLFPGLDGFAKSLKQNLYWYRDLNDIKTETNPYAQKIIRKKVT